MIRHVANDGSIEVVMLVRQRGINPLPELLPLADEAVSRPDKQSRYDGCID